MIDERLKRLEEQMEESVRERRRAAEMAAAPRRGSMVIGLGLAIVFFLLCWENLTLRGAVDQVRSDLAAARMDVPPLRLQMDELAKRVNEGNKDQAERIMRGLAAPVTDALRADPAFKQEIGGFVRGDLVELFGRLRELETGRVVLRGAPDVGSLRADGTGRSVDLLDAGGKPLLVPSDGTYLVAVIASFAATDAKEYAEAGLELRALHADKSQLSQALASASGLQKATSPALQVVGVGVADLKEADRLALALYHRGGAKESKATVVLVRL